MCIPMKNLIKNSQGEQCNIMGYYMPLFEDTTTTTYKTKYTIIGVKDKKPLSQKKLALMKKKRSGGKEVKVDIPMDLLLFLCMEAHEQNITLNRLINNSLRKWMDTYDD